MRKNQLGGQIGTDPVFIPASQTGHSGARFAQSVGRRGMTLTTEEKEIFDGAAGRTLQTAIRTVVDYGEIFGASRLVPLVGAPHHALSWGSIGIDPLLHVYRELVDAGLKTYAPFTSNPKPMDPVRLPIAPDQQAAVDKIYNRMEELESLNLKLGLRSPDDWSCACYVPEMGNTPEFGDFLAWSESSAITYVNSVIGARTNRNPIGIDMLCNILGKAPYFGLMTDRGRQATWLVEVKTTDRCQAQILGSAIGLKVMDGVPLIAGMDRFVARNDPTASGYLKDLGAAVAASGGVGLIHLEGLTPEAVQWGRELLREGYETYVIDDLEIERVRASYPNHWKDQHGTPKRVFLGCPHMTVGQMTEWGRRIVDAMEHAGRTKVGIPTFLFGSSYVKRAFERRNPELAGRLYAFGVSIPANCPMMWCSTPLEDAELVATDSNKTRAFTTARFFPEDVLIELIVSGGLPERALRDARRRR